MPDQPDPFASDDNFFADDDAETPASRGAEIDALQAAFKRAAAREQKSFEDMTDSEYWVALCFATREAKEAFLQKLGLLELGDKYLDGHDAAKILKITLDTEPLHIPKPKPNPRWTKFVKP